MSEKKLHILVVDDDALIRSMLEAMLHSSDISVHVYMAENGIDAIEKLNAFPETDLIISDMNMPEMDGLELIRELRKAGLDIPIIILTANNEIKIAIEAIRSGASDYLLKDENIEDTIFISIEKVMEKYRLKKQNQELLKELEQKNRELERLSFLDGLTDIPNRRYFDQVIQDEWSRAVREANPISLILIDIDYFKLFNDRYGHQEGDECLKQVAAALNNVLKRPGDFVARYGGEEFAAILPNTDEAGAFFLAETMRSKVEAIKIPHADSKVCDWVTISLGISTYIPCKNTQPSDLIEFADQALYEAKQNGRNQIFIKRKS